MSVVSGLLLLVAEPATPCAAAAASRRVSPCATPAGWTRPRRLAESISDHGLLTTVSVAAAAALADPERDASRWPAYSPQGTLWLPVGAHRCFSHL
ncbi:hypothetical protein OH77DRAFT_1428459 [Trametes cingulata]|nr:hypothetical protein OH77DRAFT_1428459 [Trametes cingulata]